MNSIRSPINPPSTVVGAPLDLTFTQDHPPIVSVPLSLSMDMYSESMLASSPGRHNAQDHPPRAVERYIKQQRTFHNITYHTPNSTTTRRKTRAVDFEPDVSRLQERLRRHNVP